MSSRYPAIVSFLDSFFPTGTETTAAPLEAMFAAHVGEDPEIDSTKPQVPEYDKPRGGGLSPSRP